MTVKEVKNAICAPEGFKASALSCGLKKKGGLDLGLIYSEVPANAAGVFTANKFPAAPVILSKKHLKNGRLQAIAANSGCANCFTGKRGMISAENTADFLSSLLKIKSELIAVASTGVIGKPLDFLKIKNSLPTLIDNLSVNAGDRFAQAIMTTDTKPKELKADIFVGGRRVIVAGVAKGAGMIAPDMATMLCFITTDALILPVALKKALKAAVNESFNLISIDGCMSTNDSVIILANGIAENKIIAEGSADYYKFFRALKEICLGLAKMIIRDAEGATKFITIKVFGAKDSSQAKKAALQIANSNLFKTAVYGENPNIGRVVAAIGASGVQVGNNLRLICSSLKKKDIEIKVSLMVGAGQATVYTSDLTPEYIRINARYN